MAFLKLFGILLCLSITIIACEQLKHKTKPNVLLVLIDDMRHLGEEEVNLIHLNNLAGKSINFRNAFAQQALCAPSRNSLLTGRRPDSLRLYDFYSYWRDFVANYKSLPQVFKENGYDTYAVGKVFHPGESSNFTDDYPYSWTERPYHPSSERYKNYPVCYDRRTKSMQKNLICPVVTKNQPDKTLPDLEILDNTLKILNKRDSEKPYFLAVGLHKPHIPLKYPKKYKDMVPIQNVQPPRFPFKPENLPLVSWHPWTDLRSRDDIKSLNISFPLGTMPHKWTIKIRQSYYAAALYIDGLIGKLLSHINYSNTIVVITSDHGWSLGENGLWAKYSNFDVALKVPLIFYVPGMVPQTMDPPVELIDIFPTLVELSGLGINIPKCRNTNDRSILCYGGKSLVPLMKGIDSSDYFAISQYPRPSVFPQHDSDKPRLKNIKIMGYSIRTKQYRYTEWVNFNSTTFTIDWELIYGGELYNHHTDPDESNNLYTNIHYEPVKKYLSELLRNNYST
ncbi:iduronate 2-sulfatase [Aricia agestis]|uniref:iduronate 2-sulfatase n=1 Tax=Aricia agestis TaxID=91739 RepID=UPI001C20647A|nr:iduronate 2-sulfatase [Aricia agestis]XP_041973463.1 iduronate 2-sulfatase [Aricia agestis]